MFLPACLSVCLLTCLSACPCLLCFYLCLFVSLCLCVCVSVRVCLCVSIFVLLSALLCFHESTYVCVSDCVCPGLCALFPCPGGLTFSWFRHKLTELAHSSFYSVLVSVSVFVALSPVFHSIHSPDNYPLSHSVPLGLTSAYWSFQLYISFRKFHSAPI